MLKQETQERIEKLQDNVNEQIDHIGNNLGQVQHQVTSSKERIEEIQQRELINIRELEVLRHRTMSYTHIPLGENRPLTSRVIEETH